jgi:hypothetical protein
VKPGHRRGGQRKRVCHGPECAFSRQAGDGDQQRYGEAASRGKRPLCAAGNAREAAQYNKGWPGGRCSDQRSEDAETAETDRETMKAANRQAANPNAA